ncbi:MAG: SUMF1/EgtB/PvdO family nonheme iron enzyme [Hyphomicrobiaceae bacterium]|nr:SUMF1/EgtB/PvdO family nonheme iron enzyme [Hyphomicrobiaceae bacterium]
MTDIFISYSRHDQASVLPLAEALRALGWSVFMDVRIKTGERWDQFIEDNLKAAGCVLVVWSPVSIKRHWVLEEAGWGRREKNLVPVTIDGAEPPIGFTLFQAENISTWGGNHDHPAFRNVCEGVERLVGRPDKSSQPLKPPLGEKLVSPKPQQEKKPVTPAKKQSHQKPLSDDVPTHEELRKAPTIEGCEKFISAHGNDHRKVKYSVKPMLDRLEKEASERHVVAVQNKLEKEASELWLDLREYGSAESISEFIEEFKETKTADEALWSVRGYVFRDASFAPEMVVIKPGTFMMGEDSDQHEVTISKPFAIGRYAVTFEEWDAYVADVGTGGLFSKGVYKPEDEGWGRGRRPVINVSWEDAQAYIKWLNGKTGKTYRLPTEAEWEYACRAETTTQYSFGDNITRQQANFGGDIGKTTQVGKYPANPFGLHDMHGNVWEWCQDWYGGYKKASQTDPKGPQNGLNRVIRGGSWGSNAGLLRSADRALASPDDRGDNLGFRLLRQPS